MFETIDEYTDRLKVPGGWIIRTMRTTFCAGSSVSVHTVFIEDKGHSWVIQSENE